MRPSKDESYMEVAKTVSHRSTCKRRHYGAVIVQDDQIIATGYNGAPRGIPNCCDTGYCGREGHEHNDGDYSTCPAVHAEANAIISAARRDMIGSVMYLYGEDENGNEIPAVPCPICQGLIRNAGIAKVVNEEDIHGKR